MTIVAGATRVSFLRGIPSAEAIPTADLLRETTAVLEEDPELSFQYAPLGGYTGDPALRAGLGVFHSVDPDSIFIGNGSLQVLDLVAHHLLRGERRDVVVEAPTYDRAVQIFERHGARVIGVPLQPDGLDVDALGRLLAQHAPAFLYTIPDFQNPSGATMVEAKRRALVHLAAATGMAVVEDMPYRELRYHGDAPPSLREIGGGARVITISSLSKTLSPGLRVGYAISDAATASELAALAESTYLSPPPLFQRVAARCLAHGVVAANIERIRTIIRPRHDAAVAAARDAFGDGLVAVPDGGYFLGAHLPVADEATLLAAARQHGVELTRGSAFYPPGSQPPAGTVFVRLPFHALEPSQFAAGVERLLTVARQG